MATPGLGHDHSLDPNTRGNAFAHGRHHQLQDNSTGAGHDGVTRHGVCPSASGRRVLVVDADPGCRMIVAELLADADLVPLTCPSIAEAPEIIHQTLPDAVIVDPWLGPDGNAMHVLDQIRADPTMRAIPIIVCSADNAILHEHAVTWQRYRCQIIPKPFDMDVLLDAVRAVVVPSDGLAWPGAAHTGIAER